MEYGKTGQLGRQLWCTPEWMHSILQLGGNRRASSCLSVAFHRMANQCLLGYKECMLARSWRWGHTGSRRVLCDQKSQIEAHTYQRRYNVRVLQTQIRGDLLTFYWIQTLGTNTRNSWEWTDSNTSTPSRSPEEDRVETSQIYTIKTLCQMEGKIVKCK